MAFEMRKVSGGGVNIFGCKTKHPRLKEHNGKEVLIDTTSNGPRYYTVVLDMKRELICVIGR